MKKKTRTELLNEQNAKAVRKQKEHNKRVSELRIAVRDGKMTAAEALRLLSGHSTTPTPVPQPDTPTTPETTT